MIKVAIVGASKILKSDVNSIEEYQSFGAWCADEGFNLLTGACGGIPYIIGKSCIENGGTVIGYSPASTIKEHTITYSHPTDGCSKIIYFSDDSPSFTSRFIARSIPMLEICDIVVAFSGSWGTMYELIISLFNAKTIVLCGDSGGASRIFYDNHLLMSREKTFIYNETVILASSINEVKEAIINVKK